MPGRPGVSESDIRRVLLPMLQNGESPSIQNIRKALGGTGSPATIQKHLKTVFARLAENEVNVLPGGLPESLSEPLTQLWNAAVEQATTFTDQKNIELAQRAEQAESELAHLRGRHREIEGRVETLREHLAERDNQLDTAQRTNADARADLVAAESRVRTLEQAVENVESKAQEQIDTLNTTIRQLRDDLKESDKHLGEMRTRLAEAGQTEESATLKKVKRERNTARTKLKRAQDYNQRAARIITKLRERRYFGVQRRAGRLEAALSGVKERITPDTGRRSGRYT